MKRANVLLCTGGALLVVGLLAAASIRSDDAADAEELTPVLVARADLSAGDEGDDLLGAGKVSVVQVPADDAPADALTDRSQIQGRELAQAVPSGATLTADAVAAPPLRSASMEIPEGTQAVAFTVDFTAGGAGYIGTGDRVNVYSIIAPDSPGAPSAPRTQLLLSDVEVLDVSNEVAPRRTAADPDATTTSVVSRATEGQLTLLLALDAADAERAIFADSINALWFSVLPEDQGPSTTPGVTYDDNYLPAGS